MMLLPDAEKIDDILYSRFDNIPAFYRQTDKRREW